METHPDRAKITGENQSIMSERFREVNFAYEKLKTSIGPSRFIVSSKAAAPPDNTPRSSGSSPVDKPVSDHFYKGKFPTRRLLIGQYLYYSRIISWRTLINAICWQKTQRPPIGQIALKWGILTSEDIIKILKERRKEADNYLKFGEYALSNGYITRFEQMALLGKQNKSHRPLGEYFIQKGIIETYELDRLLTKLGDHNRGLA
jgi:hypothetical protein